MYSKLYTIAYSYDWNTRLILELIILYKLPPSHFLLFLFVALFRIEGFFRKSNTTFRRPQTSHSHCSCEKHIVNFFVYKYIICNMILSKNLESSFIMNEKVWIILFIIKNSVFLEIPHVSPVPHCFKRIF